MEELQKSAVEHIDSWMKHLGQVWLDDIDDKIGHIGELRRCDVDDDGSVAFDIEILVDVVRESFHRLAYYSIEVISQMMLI